MSIDDFLGKLEGVSASGSDSWTARCPAHGDSTPSLSVAVKDGRILVHCHAGCTASDIVSAMGLKMSNLFLDEKAPKEKKPRKERSDGGKAERAALGKKQRKPDDRKWVCDYVYTDEKGTVLYKASRYVHADGRKDFVMMRPDPGNKFGWSFGLKAGGVPRVPYRLPNIVKAAAAHRQVIVVEGEKDVHSVEKALGMAATCNVGGALKWGVEWPADWGKWFDGVSGVLIIADNDPKTKTDEKGKEHSHWRGQKHAWDVQRQLREAGYAGAIKLMVMPQVDGAKHVKDFTDWVEARQQVGLAADRAAFEEALRGAGEWPEEWKFDAETLADAASEKVREGGVPASARAVYVEANGGRFGEERPPRSPSGARVYSVDFRTGGLVNCLIEMSRDEFLRIWDETVAGKTVHHEDWVREPLATMIWHAGHMAQACLHKDEGSLNSSKRSDLAALVALLWLRSRGKFFWDENARGFETSLYFDERTGVLMRVRSDEFAAFLSTASEVNRETPTFRRMMALVDDAALDPQVSRGVLPSSMWDRRGNTVYVSNGDAEMYRIAGGAVEKVQNGTDGVVFMRGKTLAPFEVVDGDGVDPFANAKIFTGASWAEKDVGPMNVRLWVLNLFACHQTKPIMLITGLAQSGKTRMAKAIKEMLGVRQDGRLDLAVQQVEDGDKGLDAFWAAVNDGKLEVFDNLDTKIKWVSDALQNVATDGQTKRRTLYTTFGVSTLRANANIILTSNNPMFSTEGGGGMADRIITINLDMNRSVAMDTELSEDIAEHRDEFLTWILRTVAKAMQDTKPVEGNINRRHPDYGIFSVRCGRAFGDEDGVVRALESAELTKSLLPLRNDFICKEVLLALARHGNQWKFTAGDMSLDILNHLADEPDEKTKAAFGARRVGKAIARFKRQFAALYQMAEPRLLEGKTLYEVFGLTRAAMVLGGGMVDLEGGFGKTSVHPPVHTDFSQNAGANPPYPPADDAHARADVSSSSHGEEEDSVEIGEYDDLSF